MFEKIWRPFAACVRCMTLLDDEEVTDNGKMWSFLLNMDRSKQHVMQQKITDTYQSAVLGMRIIVHSHFLHRKMIGSEEQSGGEGEVELLILKNGLIHG